MGPLPKRRWSTRRQGKKRASHTLKMPSLCFCPNCHEPKSSHSACPKCGFYKGKKVIEIKTRKRPHHENSK